MFSEPLYEVKSDVINDVINEKELLILSVIRGNKNITKKGISDETNISLSTVDRIVKRLRDKGVLERVGSNKTGHWIVKI